MNRSLLYKLSAVIAALALCVFAFSYFFIQDGELALPGEKPVAAAEESSAAEEEPEEDPAATEEEASEEATEAAEETNAMASLAEAHDALLAIRELETEEDFLAQGFVENTDEMVRLGYIVASSTRQMYSKSIEVTQGNEPRTWSLRIGEYGLYGDQQPRYSVATRLEDADEAFRLYNEALEYFTGTYGAPSERTAMNHTTVREIEEFNDSDIPDILAQEGYLHIGIIWTNPPGFDGEILSQNIIKTGAGDYEFTFDYVREQPAAPAWSTAYADFLANTDFTVEQCNLLYAIADCMVFTIDGDKRILDQVFFYEIEGFPHPVMILEERTLHPGTNEVNAISHTAYLIKDGVVTQDLTRAELETVFRPYESGEEARFMQVFFEDAFLYQFTTANGTPLFEQPMSFPEEGSSATSVQEIFDENLEKVYNWLNSQA